ncbi:MAG TPA: ferritin family protein [Bacteroidota bacterium]|nr:ferritin family protein [Bacteroidota bacterium]
MTALPESVPHHGREGVNWNEMSIRDILQLAIADEEEARDYYRHAAELTASTHTRQILLSLSAMEQGHADTLRKELDELLLQQDLETPMAD